MARFAYNAIRSLTMADGQTISNPEGMSDIAISHFKDILAPSEMDQISSSFQWLLEIQDFRCSLDQQGRLSTSPSAAEIIEILMKLNPNKSPGPDGFTSGFFKSAWSVIRDELVSSIQRFFATGLLPRSTNATILTLVPKKPGASSISDFIPISCCNSSYKVISKALVRRLKLILPQVILPNQTAFIKGHLLIENTLLVSEIVQGYHKRGGPKRITIKVDIAKAFDTLRWDFLFQCLRGLLIPEEFLRWLEACICTTSFSVTFNGSTYGYFKGKRGLRQGDPLSPYLFVLAMNCLSLSLNKAALEEKFKYHHKCIRTRLTHLCFADDLLIFTDGIASSVASVLQVLKEFEDMAGLAMIIQKTSMFTAGLRQDEIDQIKIDTNLIPGSLPIRYLGVPLCTKKINLDQCSTLIQSIKSKIHSSSQGSQTSGQAHSFFHKDVSLKLTLSVIDFCGKVNQMVKAQQK